MADPLRQASPAPRVASPATSAWLRATPPASTPDTLAPIRSRGSANRIRIATGIRNAKPWNPSFSSDGTRSGQTRRAKKISTSTRLRKNAAGVAKGSGCGKTPPRRRTTVPERPPTQDRYTADERWKGGRNMGVSIGEERRPRQLPDAGAGGRLGRPHVGVGRLDGAAAAEVERHALEAVQVGIDREDFPEILQLFLRGEVTELGGRRRPAPGDHAAVRDHQAHLAPARILASRVVGHVDFPDPEASQQRA